MNRIRFFLFLYALNYFSILNAQENQENQTPKNFVFVAPTSFGGTLWLDLGNNFWLDLGFSRQVKRSLWTFTNSLIVASWEMKGNYDPKYHNILLGPGITQISSNGSKHSLEYGYLLNKHFYIGGQCYFQQTSTSRKEQYFLDAQNPSMPNIYIVRRYEISLSTKVGFQFFLKKDISCDVGLALGGRHVSSSPKGKKNPEGNLHTEYITDKTFDSGNKFAQRISLHVRLGYAF